MSVEIEGLTELLSRLERWPGKARRVLKTYMDSILLALWESVPGYPPKPAESTYDRTGTLGRTLGSSAGGGMSGGQPDIYEVRDGSGYMEGEFGTRLEYAPYVIGDYVTDQAEHMRHWWTLPQDVLHRAMDKIERLGEAVKGEITDYLAGKSD